MRPPWQGRTAVPPTAFGLLADAHPERTIAGGTPRLQPSRLLAWCRLAWCATVEAVRRLVARDRR